MLAEYNFLRVHHSHLINLGHVMRYIKGDGGDIIMVDNSKIEVSRRKKDYFLQAMSKVHV